MTIKTTSVSLTAGTAILLQSGAGSTANSPISVMVQNPSTNSASIFVGGSDVTSSGGTQGLEVPPGSTFTVDMSPGDNLYGISVATQSVIVLRSDQ